jgi:hypothetical protein
MARFFFVGNKSIALANEGVISVPAGRFVAVASLSLQKTLVLSLRFRYRKH